MEVGVNEEINEDNSLETVRQKAYTKHFVLSPVCIQRYRGAIDMADVMAL